MIRKILLLIFFLVHCLLIVLNNIRSTIGGSIRTKTYLTSILDTTKLKAANNYLSKILFGDSLFTFHQEALWLYMNLTGQETAYGFFSPRVSSSYKLVFEIQFQDGSTKLVLPTTSRREIGLRFANFYDAIATANFELYRDVLVKRLAENTIKQYPEAVGIRAIFGVIATPSLNEYRLQPHLDYQYLYVYNFNLE